MSEVSIYNEDSIKDLEQAFEDLKKVFPDAKVDTLLLVAQLMKMNRNVGSVSDSLNLIASSVEIITINTGSIAKNTGRR